MRVGSKRVAFCNPLQWHNVQKQFLLLGCQTSGKFDQGKNVDIALSSNLKVMLRICLYKTSCLFLLQQYERTTQAVYEVENSIDTLLNLLQMYRAKAGDKISEKGGSIFTKTCCLLAILSKDSKRALVRLSVLFLIV